MARERQTEPPPFPEAESSGGTEAVRPDSPRGGRGLVSAPQGDGTPSTLAGPRPLERQPWDQQPGESARAFRRLLFCLHTGQQRTIRTAYLDYRRAAGKDPTARRFVPGPGSATAPATAGPTAPRPGTDCGSGCSAGTCTRWSWSRPHAWPRGCCATRSRPAAAPGGSASGRSTPSTTARCVRRTGSSTTPCWTTCTIWKTSRAGHRRGGNGRENAPESEGNGP